MLSHPLTNFEIQKYYQNKPEFKGIYSRNNLFKIKYRGYLFNLDEYKLMGTHWIALYVNGDTVTYLIPSELNTFQEKLKHLYHRKCL